MSQLLQALEIPSGRFSASLRSQITSARGLLEEQRRPPREKDLRRFRSGLEPMDEMLGGGIEPGELWELRGEASSGRFTLASSFLADATAGGETAALVDLGGHLEPEQAQAAGVDLERLLWVRPERTRDALGAAEILMSAQLPLVVVDLGRPPLAGGKGAEAHWLRLARTATRHRTALLISVPYAVSGTAASGVVRLSRALRHWNTLESTAPSLLLGVTYELERLKSRRRPGFERSSITFRNTPLPLVKGSEHWLELPFVQGVASEAPRSTLRARGLRS